MKKQVAYFILGIIIILVSTPLAYKSVSLLYKNQNLAEEYIPILNGFIYSFILVGILIFAIGLTVFIKDKK